ncbi:MAG TPA: hypothetical protein VH853_16595 [Polyangia bacterium]|nr:hypothetical protein [Polyangia bacterium]
MLGVEPGAGAVEPDEPLGGFVIPELPGALVSAPEDPLVPFMPFVPLGEPFVPVDPFSVPLVP